MVKVEMVTKRWFTGVVMSTASCTHHAMVLGVLVISMALACAGEDDLSTPTEVRTCLDPDVATSRVPDWPIVYTTEHLDIHVDDERFLCAGSAIDLQQHVDYVSRELGVEIQRRTPVYLVETTTQWCPEAAGCLKPDGVVFAGRDAVHHELTHAVACAARFGGPATLVEGLAVSFEPVENSSKGEPREFSEVRPDEFTAYYLQAGHFVRWLLEELGSEAFMELYTTTSYDDGVWTAMEDAYGATLADDYAAESPAMWVPHRQCADLSVLEPVDGTWTFSGRIDCSDPSTYGPYERDRSSYPFGYQKMYRSVLIDIETPGAYTVERRDFGTQDKVAIRFERCLDEHPVDEAAIDTEWVEMTAGHVLLDVSTVEFEHAGLWRVDMLRPHGPAWDVEVVITPGDGAP